MPTPQLRDKHDRDGGGLMGNPVRKHRKKNKQPKNPMFTPYRPGKSAQNGGRTPAPKGKGPKYRDDKGGNKDNKNKGGGKGGGSPFTGMGPMSYYGFGTPPNVSRKQAQTLVQQDINSQVRDLMQQIGKQRDTSQYDQNKIKALYDRTAGDLDYVFGEAQDYIGAQNQKIMDKYNQTHEHLNNKYNNFQGAAQQRVAQDRAAALAEQERLGIQQSGMGQFDADATNNANVANINQQNLLANLDTMEAGSKEVGALLQSMGQASLASAKGRALNSRQDALSDSRQNFREYFNDQLNRINDVKAGKGQAVNELAMAMQNNSFQQWMDMQQANFNNQMAANNFNLDVAGLNSNNLWKKAAQAQKAAELRWKKKSQQAQWDANNLANQYVGAAGSILDGLW